MAYGYTAMPDGPDPMIDLAELTLERFSQSSQPGSWLVDVFPARKLAHLLLDIVLTFLIVPQSTTYPIGFLEQATGRLQRTGKRYSLRAGISHLNLPKPR